MVRFSKAEGQECSRPFARIFDPVRLFHVVDDERRLLRQAGRQQGVLIHCERTALRYASSTGRKLLHVPAARAAGRMCCGA